jgi:hypothetical protein
MDIQRGRIYRAKKPANSRGLFNDRQVLYVTEQVVQYDGPAVGFGRHYPTVTREQFEAWAGEDVTDKMPKGEWMDWPPKFRAKKGVNAQDTVPATKPSTVELPVLAIDVRV